MTPTVKVYVQCPPQLRPDFERCRAAIEASDIGKDYTICLQKPGLGVFEHFLDILDQMAASGTDLVVRLEDDIDVNLHFLHNIKSWPRIHDESFGMGWLFDPGGGGYTIHDKIYGRAPSHEYVPPGRIAYSLAAVMWTRDVPAYRRHCQSWDARLGGDAQDLALSEAPSTIGKDLVVHAPSLVEHLLDLPSTLKHVHSIHATSMGSFKKEWKRGADRIDAYGRIDGVQ